MLGYAGGTHVMIVSDAGWAVITDGPLRFNKEYDVETYDARPDPGHSGFANGIVARPRLSGRHAWQRSWPNCQLVACHGAKAHLTIDVPPSCFATLVMPAGFAVHRAAGLRQVAPQRFRCRPVITRLKPAAGLSHDLGLLQCALLLQHHGKQGQAVTQVPGTVMPFSPVN